MDHGGEITNLLQFEWLMLRENNLSTDLFHPDTHDSSMVLSKAADPNSHCEFQTTWEYKTRYLSKTISPKNPILYLNKNCKLGLNKTRKLSQQRGTAQTPSRESRHKRSKSSLYIFVYFCKYHPLQKQEWFEDLEFPPMFLFTTGLLQRKIQKLTKFPAALHAHL